MNGASGARPREPAGVVLTATPETRRKLRADVVVRLWRTGRLGAAQVRAALDLRTALHALERGLMPAAEPGRMRVDGQAAWDPLDRLSPAELAAVSRYTAWARRWQARAVGRGRWTVLAVAVAVAVDNAAPRSVDREAGLRAGRALALTADALADLAATRPAEGRENFALDGGDSRRV